MNITIDTAAATPPFEQVRQQLEGLIVGGLLPDGMRLPTIRQLASDLGVAVGTVARAYAELEAAQLVRTERSKGTRVRASSHPRPQVEEAADAFIAEAARDGLSLSAMLAMVRARSTIGTNPG